MVSTFIVGVFLSLFFLLFVAEYYFFVYSPYKTKGENELLIVHFIHGSVPQPECNDQRIRPGGLWGGHIEVEIDEVFYSFNRISKERKIHIFSKKNPTDYNALFVGMEKSAWLKKTENDKITAITIPIAPPTKEKIKRIYQSYLVEVPYDYALFGMRCTSSAHHILAKVEVFRAFGQFGCLVFSFYPKLMRRKVVAFGVKNSLKISLKKGIECRDWE
jgi:hypothetical protein